MFTKLVELKTTYQILQILKAVMTLDNLWREKNKDRNELIILSCSKIEIV